MTQSPSPSVDEVAEARAIVAEMQERNKRNDFLTDWWREKLDALAASLVSPPKAGAGELQPFAWHWWAADKMSTWPVWSLGAERPKNAPDDAIPLYANHEARGDGVREAIAALKPLAAIAENNVDDDGWAGSRCERERIVDWFGPSDFRAALAALSLEQGEKP